MAPIVAMAPTVAARWRIALALALIACGGSVRAQSSDYPNRPIKMLVGFAAGGGTDVAARVIAQKMSEILGQGVVVENRTGASGLIAAQDLMKSDPDGYTLMMGSQTTCAVAPALYHKITVDPVKDFSGVALTGALAAGARVNPNFAAHSVADVIALAKASPGKINFGTGGVGTTPHMTAELFQYIAGIRMVHVAYRGEAPAINDLLAGQIPLMFANLSAVMGNVKAGTLRALAVTSAQRSPSAPEIPTVAETALPGFDSETWFGIVAPAGTPHDIRAKLNAAALKALASDDTKKRYLDLGMVTRSSGPEEFDAYIKAEVGKWSGVIKEANVQALD